MSYDECYNLIIENFKNKINTKDKILKMKVFNNLLYWYKNNFEDALKKYCAENNKLGIIYIFKRVEELCKKDDYTKLKTIIFDKNYEECIKISYQIFSLVMDLINKKNVNFTDDDYILYQNMLNDFENRMHPSLKDDYAFVKSECILDLLYLKNNGNVTSYSLRTSKLLGK